jgi:hypothetical protein
MVIGIYRVLEPVLTGPGSRKALGRIVNFLVRRSFVKESGEWAKDNMR